MKGGDIDEEQEGRKRGALRGSHRDRGGRVWGALEDEGALSAGEEGGDPVDHVGRYVPGEQERPKFGRVDVVKAGLYVEEEGGHLQKGPLKGVDLVGEGGHRIRGAEAGEGAALVGVK